MKRVIINLPDGYEDTAYFIAVVPPTPGSGRRLHQPVREWAVSVFDGNGIEVEEIGCAGSLIALLADARKVINRQESAP